MKHYQFALAVFENWVLYALVYAGLIALYVFVYRKIYWSLIDPMFITVINMVGGAFCVFFLAQSQMLQPGYGESFIGTELGMLAGLSLSRFLPAISFPQNQDDIWEQSESEEGLTSFDVFAFVVGSIYLLCELINFKTLGVALYTEAANHVAIYNDHGILAAFVLSYRTIIIAVLFYKHIILKAKWNYFDLICLLAVLFGLLTSGSKSSILVFLYMFYIVRYPLVLQGKLNKIKVSLPLAITLISFPIIIIVLTTERDTISAFQSLYIRFLASGDIFLLGYYDEVMANIQEKSFFKYAFYAGWGSIIKNLGFPIIPPKSISVDVYEYHYNMTTGGPNGRHNYIGLHFFGFYGSIVYSFIIGLIAGYLRKVFCFTNPLKMSYILYLVLVLIAFHANMMIDDLALFMSYIFWRTFLLLLSFVIASVIYTILKSNIKTSPQVRQG